MRFVMLPVVRWMLRRPTVLLILYVGWRWIRSVNRIVGVGPSRWR